ncbi:MULTISPECIES: hypothetical protein [unclassified Bradyrhizobium]|uniref:hypothetical protein n=1 Tax=unclassified Bradyrhizobium TaxID=2631580 RepID=UPI0024799C1A|nr:MULTISPECIES: hypothetical protein [unclassified Bradyrhizobium]WGS23580.1 hypothetical protein MTX22_19340 [Bradyrhizobium sp. ISRA463]WGS30604.1 hypothetical protein MTX19_17050 [Bradyrhizobium sp. ISRA464]
MSNLLETINLRAIAATGIAAGRGPLRASVRRLRQSAVGPIFELPTQPLGRTGSGNLEKRCWRFRDGLLRQSRNIPDALTGFPWEFERLSHVAIHVHIPFVVGAVSAPNEQ